MVGSGRGHMSVSRNDIATSARGANLTLISYLPPASKDEHRALCVVGSRPRVARADQFVGLPADTAADARTRHRDHGSPEGIERTALRDRGKYCPIDRHGGRPESPEGSYPARSGSPEWVSHTPHRSPSVHNTRSGPCVGTAGDSPRRSRRGRPALSQS